MANDHTACRTISHSRETPLANDIAAAALAALGAASAIPIPLAQLDFAGLINVFNIHHGDAPGALLVIAAAGGMLTFAVLALALAGSFLAATGARSARTLLIAAALAGVVTAMPLSERVASIAVDQATRSSRPPSP